jgi:hypothetical protein
MTDPPFEMNPGHLSPVIAIMGLEAVSLYAPLASADPDRYREGYEQAIQSLTAHLIGLGPTEREIADELDRRARGD